MDLTQEQLSIQKMVRDFARKEIAPRSAEYDQKGEFPYDLIRKAADLGLLGVPFPEEYDGAGLDYMSYALVIEEISKVDSSVGITILTHTSNSMNPIWEFGTEEQRKKYIPPLARGEKIAAYCLTEPNAGSDARALETTAIEEGDHFVMNGSKVFITNGSVAETYVVVARTDPELGTKGISMFILEKGMEGLRPGKKEDKMGWRASDTTEVIFENVKVPKENLLGARGRGFYQAMKQLAAGRFSVAALSLGIAEGAFEEALKYSKQREQFGKPICEFQAVQAKLADMAVGIACGKHLTYRAARLRDRGEDVTTAAAMAKLYCSELAMENTTEAVQIHGAYGITKDYPVERFMRDAKACTIGEGTSEIQRIIIAKQMVKGAFDWT
ncbi:MAG: acyl-CoA dehydrogenase [Candidatus Eisenbacteria bacterium]